MPMMTIFFGHVNEGTYYQRLEYGISSLISEVGGFMNAINKSFQIVIATICYFNVTS